MKKAFYLMALAALLSCSSDEDVTPAAEGEVTYTLSRTTAYGDDWIYFSLTTGQELDIDESSHYDDLTWDLAFNRYNVRTNGGTSGAGLGAAYDTGLTDMAAVTSVPADAQFTVDTMGQITESFTGSGVTYLDSSLSSVLATACSFSGPPPTYDFNYHVYIVRTAAGQYAKLQLQSFYDNSGNSGYLTFAYELMD